MIDLNAIIRQLLANGQAVQALLETIPYDQAVWKPDANTWSLAQTMDHLYNEERGDFRAHIQEILSQPQVAWGAMQPPGSQITSLKQGLTDFLRERAASITWLRGLEGANWDTALTASFGPQNEQVTLRAGDRAGRLGGARSPAPAPDQRAAVRLERPPGPTVQGGLRRGMVKAHDPHHTCSGNPRGSLALSYRRDAGPAALTCSKAPFPTARSW
jgi:hypothetical protein